MNQRHSSLIRTALFPWSLWLKQLVRENRAAFLFQIIGNTGQDSLFPAWLYWLLDGDTDAAKGILESAQGSDVPIKIQIYTGKELIYEILFLPADAAQITEYTSGKPVQRVFPEGDGLFYRDMEIREQGESRILPDEVLDEAFHFADSVIESFNRKV